MTEELFDPATTAQESPRLTAIREADIQTQEFPGMPDPWIAIPMHAAREALAEYDAIPDEGSVPMIAIKLLLEDVGLVFRGQTEREAQDQALSYIEEANNLSKGSHWLPATAN